MARNRKSVRMEESPRKTGPIRQFAHVVETIVVLVIIGYVAALLLSRTDGFRSLAADRLEDIVGMPVHIEKSSARWNLDVEFRQLSTESNGQQNQPGVRADRVMLDWSPLSSLRHLKMVWSGAEIEGGDITFATTVSGQWEPAQLAPVSEQIAKWLGLDLKHHVRADAEAVSPKKPDAAEGKKEEKRKWNASRLRIRKTNIAWWAEATNELARLDGLALDVTPLDTPGHHITHYLLKLDRAESRGGLKMNGVNIELMDAADQQVVLTFQADREATSLSRTLDLSR